MRITYFRIENFRNIRLAECRNPPDFMVVCGGNGCGKSAFLRALMTAKEQAGQTGGFQFDPSAVSVDAETACITMGLRFNCVERGWYEQVHKNACPEEDEIVVELGRGGGARTIKRSDPTAKLLSWYSRTFRASPGFFEYIGAHRTPKRKQLSTWNPEMLSDDRCKRTLAAPGDQKFQFTKEYLASLVMRDLQHLQSTGRAENPEFLDSLKPIRTFFNAFFAPMEFVDVQIDSLPVRRFVCVWGGG